MMNEQTTEPVGEPIEARETYFAMARSWAEDNHEALRRSRRLAWIIACVAAGVAVLEGLALVALMPLKTVVPYTLLVDKNTGFVEALDGTQLPTITGNTALIQSLLAQYVVAREGFDINTVNDQYHKVALWSSGDARRDYLAKMVASNPESPFSLYPRSAVISVEIESVSSIGPQTALVRFRSLRHDAGRGAATPAYWVAVMAYRFAREPQTIADRMINPLGFQLVHYRRDPEAPPAKAEVDASDNTPADAAATPSPAAPDLRPLDQRPRRIPPPNARATQPSEADL